MRRQRFKQLTHQIEKHRTEGPPHRLGVPGPEASLDALVEGCSVGFIEALGLTFQAARPALDLVVGFEYHPRFQGPLEPAAKASRLESDPLLAAIDLLRQLEALV